MKPLNPEMWQFIPDHLKTETLCNHVIKKLPYLLRYVPDQYEPQQMYDEAI